MTWQELQLFLKGKIFLIGLTFIDEDEKLIEQYQTSGTVEELTDAGLLKFKRADGSIFQLPYDRDTIKQLEEGEYREKGTGRVITNPHYLTTWEIKVQREDNLADMKQNGYIP